jgi:hypothetical protein
MVSLSPSVPQCQRRTARNEPGGHEAAYNPEVPSFPLSADTAADVERMQVEGWRRMSAAEKAALISGLTQAAYDLALAGVRHRHPDASPREQFLRLALITLGHDLAIRTYPEIIALHLA